MTLILLLFVRIRELIKKQRYKEVISNAYLMRNVLFARYVTFLIGIALILTLISNGISNGSIQSRKEFMGVQENGNESFGMELSSIITLNYTENIGFDFVFHENQYFKYPHATFPALVQKNSSFSITFLRPPPSNISIGLGNRETNEVYLWNISQTVTDVLVLRVNEIISNGLYDLLLFNLTASGLKLIDSQPHSVKIYSEASLKFVHVSDTHLPLFTEDTPTISIVSQVFSNISKVKPDFVLLTGDLIEATATYMVNESTGKPPLYTYSKLLEIGLRFLDQWDFPVFVTAGNHDWMKVYPSRNYSMNEWFSYMYPGDYQYFQFNGFTFIGYSILNEMSNELLINLKKASTMNALTSQGTIVYTHFDYDERLLANADTLNLKMSLQGHTHRSSITYKNQRLWVITHSAFNPQLMEPKTGFRVIKFVNSTHIQIDNTIYPFLQEEFKKPLMTTEKEQTTPENTQNLTFNSYLDSILIGVTACIVWFNRIKSKNGLI